MPETRRIASCLGLAAWVFVSPMALADVYKCAGDGGIPVYQETPCGPAKELRNFQTDPPEITILPAQRVIAAPPDAIKNAPPKNGKTDTRDAKAGKAAVAGDATERMHLRVGMSESEVLARLGPPDMTIGAKNAPSPRWTYTPAPGDPETITTLMFTKGVLVDIERKVVKK
jgi:Domain of unknown function (DUF4124)